MKTKYLLISGISLFFGLLSGCSAGGQTRATIVIPLSGQQHIDAAATHRPFPRAPKHGYRHRYYDHDLQFDSNFGAYVVTGSPGLYFYGGNYLRFHNERWQITTRLRHSWRFAGEHDIPHRLRQARPNNRHNDYEERHDAPRHGFRRQYQGHELSYDSSMGAYVVIQQPGIYFYNNRYLRRHQGRWQSTNKLNGTWRSAKEKHLPRKSKKARHAKKDKHKRKERH